MGIDATVGGASANSYVTALEAETYFETRFDSGSWTDATDGNKSGSLLGATGLLEQREYIGTAVDTTQILQWPRSGVQKRTGFQLESTTAIPQRVKNATYELAFALIEGTIDLSPANDAFTGNLKVGPISLPPRIRNAKTKWPQIVTKELRGLLLNSDVGTVRA